MWSVRIPSPRSRGEGSGDRIVAAARRQPKERGRFRVCSVLARPLTDASSCGREMREYRSPCGEGSKVGVIPLAATRGHPATSASNASPPPTSLHG